MSAGLRTLRNDRHRLPRLRQPWLRPPLSPSQTTKSRALSSLRTNAGAYRPMIDEITLGRASSIAWHCASKSGNTPSAALSGTSGPHCARYSRCRLSSSASRFGARPGNPEIDLKLAFALRAKIRAPRRDLFRLHQQRAACAHPARIRHSSRQRRGTRTGHRREQNRQTNAQAAPQTLPLAQSGFSCLHLSFSATRLVLRPV